MSISVPSPNFYEGRRSAIKWIVWHSTESGEVKGGAYNVAKNWFALAKSQASAHIVADDGADPRYPDGIVRCVDPADTAWHAKAASSAGYGVEIVGRAGQSGVDWTDPYSLSAIRNACAHIKTVPELAHIPARWLTDEQLRRGESGHITHAQVSRVLGGTHWDPGPAFPRDHVMACLVGQEEEDMPLTQQDAALIFWGTPFDGPRNFAQYIKDWANASAARESATLAVAQKIATNPDVTAEALARLIDESVAKHTPTPDQNAAALLPVVQTITERVLGVDNTAQAAEILRQLGDALTPPAATSSGKATL
ncbi:MAG TPA: N-acetylmuramoyl-L-alanine amidase [Actinokineospora sp.]|nr:N-acetylmuramoyl-L-alanine amidase [Actinokineospora sp.]